MKTVKTTNNTGPVIVAVNKVGDCRTGTLKNISVERITNLLGFKPNMQDDPCKVKHSWGFTVDGERCGVWDYRGSHTFGQFSTFGPAAALSKVFGDSYESSK